MFQATTIEDSGFSLKKIGIFHYFIQFHAALFLDNGAVSGDRCFSALRSLWAGTGSGGREAARTFLRKASGPQHEEALCGTEFGGYEVCFHNF